VRLSTISLCILVLCATTYFSKKLLCTTFSIMYEQEKGTQWHGFSNQTLNVFANYATICKRWQKKLERQVYTDTYKLKSTCQYNTLSLLLWNTHKQRFCFLPHKFTENLESNGFCFPFVKCKYLMYQFFFYIEYKDNIMHLLHISVNSVSWLCFTIDYISKTTLRTKKKSPQLLTTIQS